MSRLKEYLEKTDKAHLATETVAYLASLDHIDQTFPEVSRAIEQELADQRSSLKLIASENYSSLAVQLAMGNLLTDKYAEGASHKRFYAGCENVDTVEDLATSELKKLFDCQHAYVQPHSGADANIIAFSAILNGKIQAKELEILQKKSIPQLTDEEFETLRKKMVGQKLLGMSLNSGGHLTHGYRMNLSAKLFEAHAYDINPETGRLDYTALLKQAKEVKPLILLAGYSAYPRLIDFAKMREIADAVGAVLMVDMAHFSGLVAGKAMTGNYNPIPFAHVVTSTTHKTLRGPRGGIILCQEEFSEHVDKGCPLAIGGPLPHMMAAKAVAFKEANTPSFSEYACQIVKNSQALAEEMMALGHKVLTNGTDNHIVLVDVSSLGITGKQAEAAMREARLTCNRNALPFDQNGPWFTSGIRLGTPALTTLGMKEGEMKIVARLISETLKQIRPTEDPKTGKPSRSLYILPQEQAEKAKSEVKNLLEDFPLYPELGAAPPVFC